VTRLQVTPATADVPVGLEQQYIATAFLSDGTSLEVTNNAALSWSSSDPGIATISNTETSGKGLATGVAPGTVTITASGTANGQSFSDMAQLTVISGPFGAGCTQPTVTSDGKTYTCPLTQAEADALGIAYILTNVENGFTYILQDWSQADTYCTSLGNGYYLPSKEELSALYADKGDMGTFAGWPTILYYRSSTLNHFSNHYIVDLLNGNLYTISDRTPYYVVCVR
jgi:hypothetical protein